MSKINWAQITAKLPASRDPESKAHRTELFNSMDPNGNGYLSLAEVDKGLRDVLQLDALFDCKPAIMRSWQAAKKAGKSRARLGDDYVERAEFRLLLVYLRNYFELYQMFDRIDTSDDRRIDPTEFKRAVGMINTWGLKISDPAAEFKKIDKNGGGLILFDEFCDWALKHKLDLEDDDD
mmetsp:Transcript_24241/g.52978  ORF Transcript_24241/g.52978 Transcript_24241/m.52978 type:complete len:179 (+) Transcript_24241:112-648(+)|eukprot:CAMPEP_0202901350 /NCGR_PEP_ID=MMETSP1392-20130828/14204_1 /ASSEMBLY_ACC=CAM_ASM_000868 /TAXON_ID=225041 /ORGANISM="Chlamydomonas chlamydogama, Strain SAG 11-48b" /LENGTH=178 /DNA_ID=CAMNT_0049587899 /DNA_START=106 /DNA_END=642 /DNA_ORIENTATION=+